ncbi:MAG: hypothetical protein MI923_16310 [Phycisphaerales bacterium]|nr:hypothetical protein [Phycisphaerales bacterium]
MSRSLRHPSLAQLSNDDRELIELTHRDPAIFAKLWFDRHVLPHQYPILESLATKKRTAVRTGNTIGKSAMASLAAHWWMQTHPKGGVITTAPTMKQVKDVIWAEIHNLWSVASERAFRLPSGIEVRGGLGPRPLRHRWEIEKDWFAAGVSTTRKENFMGRHPRGGLLVIVDEASGISDDIYDGIRAVTGGEKDRILAIGNPTVTNGWFHRAFHDPNIAHLWSTIHIDSEKLPWIVQGKDPPFPGLVTRQWIEDTLADCGGDKTDPIYMVHVKGEFADISDEFLLTLHECKRACEDPEGRPPCKGGKPSALGIDVARGGRSKSVLCWIRGNVVTKIKKYRIDDTEKLAAVAYQEWRDDRTDIVAVDSDGLGVGVHDKLRAKRVPVLKFNGNAKPMDERKYFNARSEGYFLLANDIRTQKIKLIDDKDLLMQLAYQRKDYHLPTGQLKLMSKEQMIKKGKASPDEADSVMMARKGQRVWRWRQTAGKARIKAV